MNHRAIRREMLAETIANIHRASQGRYGVRRVHAELVKGLGIYVGRDQVALLMSRTGSQGIFGNRKRYVNREHLITAAGLVSRQSTVDAPNQLWCTEAVLLSHHPFLLPEEKAHQR